MSEIAEVTIQKVWPPKEGKKWGNLQTAEGERYFGPPAALRQFNAGDVWKIEWEAFGSHGTGKKLVKGIVKTNTVQPPKQVHRLRTDPSDNRQIFITALLKEFIGVGKIDLAVTELVQAIKTIGEAFDRTHNPQRRDDMNDEIPH